MLAIINLYEIILNVFANKEYAYSLDLDFIKTFDCKYNNKKTNFMDLMKMVRDY